MTNESRLAELLDRMAEDLVAEAERPSAETIGGLIYLIWEARKVLGLPDIDGLHPL